MQSLSHLKFHIVFYFWKFIKRDNNKKEKKKAWCRFHISCFEQTCILQIQMECVFSQGFMWKGLPLEYSLRGYGFVKQALLHDMSFAYSSWVPFLSLLVTQICHEGAPHVLVCRLALFVIQWSVYLVYLDLSFAEVVQVYPPTGG